MFYMVVYAFTQIQRQYVQFQKDGHKLIMQ